MSIDVEVLLRPISDDQPCGEDPSYNPAFVILESAVQGQGDSQFAEAQEPNWNEVRRGAVSILEKSKELTTALYLTLALLEQEGLQGFKDGLLLIHGLLDGFWDTVHPLLDPDDNNDPLERINIITNLGAPLGTFGDPFRFIQRIRDVPLCNSRQMGRFSLRDIMIAKKEITLAEDSDETPPSMAVIEAAFKDTDSEELASTIKAVQESITLVSSIESVINERAEGEQNLKLSALTDVLTEINEYLGLGSDAEVVPDHRDGGTAEQAAQSAAPQSISGDINSQQDVLKAFEKVIKFYEINEPSSPVPMIVRRAQKLVGKNFREIVSDIASSAQSQIDQLFGPPDA